MKAWIIGLLLNFLMAFAGRVGRDALKFIDDADTHGLEGRGAFDFVWRKLKTEHSDIGDWVLNWVIENAIGVKAFRLGKLAKKLKWPNKLKVKW